MIEAAKIWNEPNNKSHWDLELDPGWTRFAEMAVLAAMSIRLMIGPEASTPVSTTPTSFSS